jgi:hypothetical protein
MEPPLLPAAPPPPPQVRAPTNVVSSICDDRGEEPTYYGVTMSELITQDYGIGDVLALLWFKRKLPKWVGRGGGEPNGRLAAPCRHAAATSHLRALS